MEEPFVFNDIVEKANETIYNSKSLEDLQYNIDEYKQFVEEYSVRKNFKVFIFWLAPSYDIGTLVEKFGICVFCEKSISLDPL